MMIQHNPVILLFTWTSLVTSEVRLPPQITVQPSDSIIFQSAQPNVRLDCEATGIPDVEYSWTRNGADFSLNRLNVEVVEGTGTFIFTTITTLDDGYYQCFAKNDYGVAKSKVSNLQRAYLISYQPSDHVAQYTATVGDKLKISCLSLKSYPIPKFNWVVSDTKDETGIHSAVVLSDRIQIDDTGNLYFSNTELSDQQNNKYYKCSAYNKDVELTSFGSYSQLTVTPGSPGESRPKKEFSYSSPIIGLVGKSVDFKCLFSGYPTPYVSWSRATGGNMPAGRTQRTEYDTKLTIFNLKLDDEGEYMCQGLNKVDQTDVIIELIVQEIPTFKEMSKRPNNINKTEGESASFYCDAAGIPTPQVQWFRNGQLLDSNSPGPGMTITNGGTNLTVYDLCKDCNGKTDLAVFQCNSSNVHGYAYGEGYLNVLMETRMIAVPANIDMIDWEDAVFFECTATSDASTPVMIIWRFNDVQIDQSQPWYEVLPNGLKVYPTKMEDAESAEGTYTCVASNGMSGKESSAYLTIPEAPAPLVTENPNDEPHFSTRKIIIIISVGVGGTVLILAVVCIACYVCCKKRKAKAPVQNVKFKKGRANPEDPINHGYKKVADNEELVDNQELVDNEEVIHIQEIADKDSGIVEKGKGRRPPPELPKTPVPREAEAAQRPPPESPKTPVPSKAEDAQPLMSGYLKGHSSEDNDQSEVEIYGYLETDPKAEWKVDSSDIIIEDEELSGANGRFADIRLANMQTDTGIFKVVAKMNKGGASDEDKLLMRAKLNYHAKAVPTNEHILKFIGEVLAPEGPILLTEYCEGGKLVDWVKKDDNSQEHKTILNFCQQIATAMKCLHDNNIVHRRMGARNMLLKIKLHNQMVVKVTGFGPMKGEHDGKGNEADQELVPIKWLAPEQIVIPKNSKRIYNNKTDVWSYGITLHEMFNKGIGPFAEMKRNEFKQKVQQGYKIDQCEGCPDKIYDEIMLKCWSVEPRERPEFDVILKCLQTMDNDSKSMQEDDDTDDQEVYGIVYAKGKTIKNEDYHQEGYEKVEYNNSTA